VRKTNMWPPSKFRPNFAMSWFEFKKLLSSSIFLPTYMESNFQFYSRTNAHTHPGVFKFAASIGPGSFHTCILVTVDLGGFKNVKCWGLNAYGQLGIGNMEEKLAPVNVDIGSGVWASYASTFCVTVSVCVCVFVRARARARVHAGDQSSRLDGRAGSVEVGEGQIRIP
jgi:hypothetical protein